MKRTILCAMLIGAVLCGAAICEAVSFTDQEIYKRGVFVNDRRGFSSSLEASLAGVLPTGISGATNTDSQLQMASASLFVTYAGVSPAVWRGIPRESWTVNISGTNGTDTINYSANLMPQRGYRFFTQEINLPGELFANTGEGQWDFTVSFVENTSGRDMFRLKGMKLAGNYQYVQVPTNPDPPPELPKAVPEPSTIFLLGMGLLWFAVARRKNK